MSGNTHSGLDTQTDESPISGILSSIDTASTTHSGHTVLELTKGSYVPTLPKCHKHTVQTALFGAPSVILDTLLPGGLSFPVEVGPVTTKCPNCGDYTAPIPTSDPSQPWISHPCCQSECGCCYQFGTLCEHCGYVTDSCCSCTLCGSCGDPADDICSECEECPDCCSCASCGYCGDKGSYYSPICPDCDQCESHCSCNDDCDCGDCHGTSSSSVKPGWFLRGWNVDISSRDAGYDFTHNYAKHMDPAQAMSDFYLCDYIMAIAPKYAIQPRSSSWVGTGGSFAKDRFGIPVGSIQNVTVTHEYGSLSNFVRLYRAAALRQSLLVSTLADAFLEYGFMAIGGEVRHHPNVRTINPTHGRENMWTYWADMGDKYGKVEMLQDALLLFRDSVWGNGYGGEAWAICTDIVLSYAKGDLDAKTFVDRCFALQHNGGSFLDKVYWTPAWDNQPQCGVSYMKSIGDAHQGPTDRNPCAETIGFGTLLKSASNDVKGLMRTLSTNYASYVPDVPSEHNASDRDRLSAAVASLTYVSPTTGERVSDLPDFIPFHPTTTETSPEVPPTTVPAVSSSTVHYAGNAAMCMDYAPSGYVCTAPVGHSGMHAAYWNETDICEGIEPWANLSDLDTSVPSSSEVDCVPFDSGKPMCGDVDPSGSGYQCTAHTGHAGAHVATYGPGKPCPTAPWTNESDITPMTPKGPISENEADGLLSAELLKAGIPDEMGYSTFSLASLKIAQSADPELEALLVVAEYIEAKVAGFAPNTTYKSISGHTLIFGATTTIATFVGHGGDTTLVGVGTQYPAYITTQDLSEWSILSVLADVEPF